MEQEPASSPWRLCDLALTQHALGHPHEADAAQGELIESFGDDAAVQIAEVYAYRGDKDRAFEWLERAYTQRDPWLSEMKGNPLLGNLQDDPRYTVFLDKMGLGVFFPKALDYIGTKTFPRLRGLRRQKSDPAPDSRLRRRSDFLSARVRSPLPSTLARSSTSST